MLEWLDVHQIQAFLVGLGCFSRKLTLGFDLERSKEAKVGLLHPTFRKFTVTLSLIYVFLCPSAFSFFALLSVRRSQRGNYVSRNRCDLSFQAPVSSQGSAQNPTL
jgi:hypothetical protein